MSNNFLKPSIFKRPNLSKLVLTCLTLSLMLSPNSSIAKTVILDRIEAIVESEAIMESEVNSRTDEILVQLTQSGQQAPPRHIINKQILERLIMESIQLQLADRMGMRIDDDSINQTMQNIAKQNNLTIEEFITKIESEGLKYQQIRSQVRRELLMNRVQKQIVNPKVRVTEQDIQLFLSSKSGKETLSSQFLVSHIMVSFKETPTPEHINETKEKAEALHQKLLDGENFTTIAISHSDGQHALEGGNIGWRTKSQLPSFLAEPVSALAVNDFSPPIRSGAGFHIIKLIEKQNKEQKVIREYQTRHILIRPSEIINEEAAKKKIISIKARIDAGENFAELAKEFSDDPGSARNGGSLDWVSIGNMVGEFEKVMIEIPTKTVSPAFLSKFGWHILEVTDIRDADKSENFRKSQAAEAIHKRKFEEALQNWLIEIRDSSFIDIKTSS